MSGCRVDTGVEIVDIPLAVESAGGAIQLAYEVAALVARDAGQPAPDLAQIVANVTALAAVEEIA